MIKTANGEIIDSIPPVIHHYLGKDVDRDRLKIQLCQEAFHFKQSLMLEQLQKP